MKIFDIYKNRKVLITGHTGFKGGWLSLWLHHLGADVYGYSLAPQNVNGIFNASKIGDSIHDYRGDIRDLDYLKEIFERVRPEIVFHLAAQPLVIEGYNNPRETFDTNVMGTVNVLEAIRNTDSVIAGVMISTDKCYENKEWVWGYREEDEIGGSDPYSASKGAAEIVISAYRKSFFNKDNSALISSVRAGNVIGGGDWAENRLVPDIFRAIINDKIINIRNPQSIRPWQFVLEPLSGYLLLGAHLLKHERNFAEAWNFGPLSENVHTVKDMVETIVKYLGKGKWQDMSEEVKMHEANILMLDISKSQRKLLWKPIFSFEETIKLTADWYMSKNDKYDFSINQIIEYEKRWK